MVPGPTTRVIAASAVAVLLVHGCGKPDAKLTPIPEDGVILAFGDSLTAGVGAGGPAHSYPSVLAELSGRRVVNAGVSGEVTAAGLARLADTLLRVGPNVVILLEGGNDILRKVPRKSAKENLAAMIEMAQRQGVEIVLIGVPEFNLFGGAADIYAELAREYQLVYAEDIIASLMLKGSHKSDTIHFNKKGYRVLAEAVYELLVEHGAL